MQASQATTKRVNEVSSRAHALQFILVGLVILIHSQRGILYYVEHKLFVSEFIIQLFSSNISRIAVPIYFIFSSYFTQISYLRKGSSYLKLIVKKAKRLIFPYILFNLIAILVAAKLDIDIPGSGRIYDKTYQNIFWQLFNSYNFPLWFLRNLFLLYLFYPIFFWFYQKCPWLGLTVFFGSYLLGWPNNSYYISEFGLAFYIGGLLSSRHFDLLILDRFKWMISMAYLSCVLAISYLMTTGYEFSRAYYLGLRLGLIYLGICSLWTVFSTHQLKLNPLLIKLSSISYFIYLTHEPTLSFTQKLLRYLFGLNSIFTQMISYIGATIIVLLLLALIGLLIQNKFIRGFKFITGEF